MSKTVVFPMKGSSKKLSSFQGDFWLLLMVLGVLGTILFVFHNGHLATQVGTASATTLTGTVEVMIEEDETFENVTTVYKLRVGKNYFYTLEPTDGSLLTKSGDEVRVSGSLSGSTVTFAGKDSSQFSILKGVPLTPDSLGEQQTLVLGVNFLNDQRQLFTVLEAEAAIQATDVFFREQSYGKTWFTGKAIAWVTLNRNTDCNNDEIARAAIDAVDPQVDFRQVDRLVIVYPYPSGDVPGFCTSHAAGYGKGLYETNDGQVLMSRHMHIRASIGGFDSLHNHELGHNLGLPHSGSWNCRPEILGTCSAVADPNGERGDSYDGMGGGGGHYNAFQKEKLGWFSPGDLITVPATGGTYTYTLKPYESQPTNPGKKVLKIPGYDPYRRQFIWYYLEWRQPIGIDAVSWPSWTVSVPDPGNGVVMHIPGLDVAQPYSHSLLLDMNPTNSPQYGYDPLLVGQTYTDPNTKTSISVVRKTSSSITVRVSRFAACSPPTDSDGDGIMDCAEQVIGTNPTAWDTDKDGCSDGGELGSYPLSGGFRDPTNPYDYYDINHDGAINVTTDILGVAGAFGTGSPKYHPAKDRGALPVTPTTYNWGGIWGSMPIPSKWEKTAPNGSIDVVGDISGVAGQFGHACPHNHALYTGPNGTPFGPHPVTLSAAIALEQAAPFAVPVSLFGVSSPAANFPSSGKLLIDAETLTYNQTSGQCPGLNTATQFCITARGNNIPTGSVPALHGLSATVYYVAPSDGLAGPNDNNLQVRSTRDGSAVTGVVIVNTGWGLQGTNGTTNYNFTSASDFQTMLRAPATFGAANFVSWTGCVNVFGSDCQADVVGGQTQTVTANYRSPNTLNVRSTLNGSPVTGVAIVHTGWGTTGTGGTTNYTYTSSTDVDSVIRAPLTFNGANFISWTGCSPGPFGGNECRTTLTGGGVTQTVTANY